jgi:MFS family permease
VTALRRNRDFVLLTSGELLSSAGSQLTSVAYPLLTLALTHSPAKAGIVGFAGLLPAPLLGLPAGEAADRWDRKRIMIAADLLRMVAIAILAVAVIAGSAGLWLIAVVAFAEGTGGVFFGAGRAGALKAVVPPDQLGDAVGVQEGRSAVVSLVGPPLGGALFNAARSLPFVVDALSYSFSFLSLIAMRTPFQDVREPDLTPLRRRFAEGFSFLWSHPFVRTTTLLYAIGNFALPGLFLVVVVEAERAGLSGGQIGLLFAAFAACLLVGSALSPIVRQRRSMRGIILVELWLGLGSALFLVWPNVYVLVASMLPLGVALPITDTVVVGYRISITPDRLLGRVEAIRAVLAQSATPLGPLCAGVLLDSVSARETVAVFTACALVLAVWGTLSPDLRGEQRRPTSLPQ